MPNDSHADIEWQDGTLPVSRRFGDVYFQPSDGLAEARHVFLGGNGLPERFRPGFRIAELGFGTGLNMLAALVEWRAAGHPGRLRYTSFEAYPLSAAEIATALAAFPEVCDLAAPLLAAVEAGANEIVTDDLDARIVTGDARDTVPVWPETADAWFLDGFSPARNPELWDPALLSQVATHTAPGGSFATFTAAGAVRRALADVGFEVARVPGFGRKRHMTIGRISAPPLAADDTLH